MKGTAGLLYSLLYVIKKCPLGDLKMLKEIACKLFDFIIFQGKLKYIQITYPENECETEEDVETVLKNFQDYEFEFMRLVYTQGKYE